LLSPGWTILAAAITVPVLIALHMLRLRRVTLRLPSTLLWPGLTREDEANAPWRRLKLSLLLLLQLLAVLLLCAALGEPYLTGAYPATPRAILLIDVSASMRAPADESGITRFEAARARAGEIARQLTLSESKAEVAVMRVGRSPRLLSGFEARGAAVEALLDDLVVSDEQADMVKALDLAGALAAARQPPALIVLVTDGSSEVGDDARRRLRGAPLRVEIVADAAVAPPNAAVTALRARRAADDSSIVEVQVVVSVSGAAQRGAVEISAGGEVSVLRPIALEAGESRVTDERVTLPGGGEVRARVIAGDAFPWDDAAALILPEPRAARVRLDMTTEQGRAWIADAIEACGAEIVSSGAPDLIIRSASMREGEEAIASISFGAAGSAAEAPGAGPLPLQRASLWKRDHPLLRHVSLDEVVFRSPPLPAPLGEEIVHAGAGAVMDVQTLRRANHVRIAFDVEQSNWPVDAGFVVFMKNALGWLAAGATRDLHRATAAGERIVVQSDESSLEARGPAVVRAEVVDGWATFEHGLPLAGTWNMAGAAEGTIWPISAVSERESDLTVRGGAEARSGDDGGMIERARHPITLWCVAAALAILTIEWLVYAFRAGR